MIRPLTLVTLCAAAGAGLYLYQVKHSVSELDRHLRDINRRTEQARERTQVLRAEWALLNEPDRLRRVAQQYLPLEPMAPTQFVRLSDMDRRLPGARQFAGPPSLFAPSEPPGDGAATPMAIATAEPRGGPAAMVVAAAAVPEAAAAVQPATAPAATPVATPAPAVAPTPAAAPAPRTAPVVAAVEAPRAEAPRAEPPAPRPARVAAATPRPAPPAVQPALHVQRRPPAPPRAQTVAANIPAPTVTSSLGMSSLGGAATLAPPVPIARAAAATLPPGMTR